MLAVCTSGASRMGFNRSEARVRPRRVAPSSSRFGGAIVKACEKHGVPPELVIMTIATEVGDFVEDGFTGPKTFRWEPGPRDYSAGPMQI